MLTPYPKLSALMALLVFPITVLCVMASATWWLLQGTEPGTVVWTHALASGLTVLTLERINPHEPSWFGSRGDVGPDWLHLLVSNMGVPRLVEATTVPLGFWLISTLTGQSSLGLWPEQLPLVLQGALALVVTELPYYWWHRLAHEVDFLWRFHAIHHSAPRLYWLNAARFHPVDTLVGYLFQVLPLVMLGASHQVLAWFTVFVALHGLFQHANLRVRLGPLNWVFSMAELHRWHHSTLLDEGNTNYGGNVIIWDIVFGTRFLPDDRDPPTDIGIGGMPAFPTSYLGQLLAPFRWQAVVAASGPAHEAAASTSAVDEAAPREHED